MRKIIIGSLLCILSLGLLAIAQYSAAGGGGGSIGTPPYLVVSGLQYGPTFPIVQPPLTGWTTINSATFDTTNNYPYVSGPMASAAQIKGVTRSTPAAPWSAIMLIYGDWSGQQAASCGECMVAFGVSDGTKYTTMMIGITATAYGQLATHWTNATTFGANAQTNSGSSFLDLASHNPVWLKVCDDGTTNIHFYWSIDGQHFKSYYSEGRLSFLASVANVFVGVYPNAGIVEAALLSYQTTGSCP